VGNVWPGGIGAAVLMVVVGMMPMSMHGAQETKTAERTERGLYLLKVVEPGYDVTVKEIERGPQHSTLELSGLVPTVTAAGTVLFKAVYDIARERGLEYTFTSPPPQEQRAGTTSRGSDGRRVSVVAKVFMTKDPKTELKALLGVDYSQEAQQLFDQRGYTSLSQLATMYGGA
jgi:hypothetical protein